MPRKKEGRSFWNKSFIWKSLRFSFWIMVGLWVASTVIGIIEGTTYNALNIIISAVLMAATFFTFVVSILHLTRYKEKGLAVTALVISSILVLMFLIAFLVGVSTTAGGVA